MTCSSAFCIRGFNLCETLLRHSPEQLRRFIRRMKTLNLNMLIVHYDYGWKRYAPIIIEECEKTGIGITLMVFGPRSLLKLAGASASLFAKSETGNPFTSQAECETQPCAGNPESIAAFRRGAELFLADLPPQIRRVHMRAGDGPMYCRCPHCAQMKSDAERFLPFAAVFAEVVQKIRPDLEFETDIYCPRQALPDNYSVLQDYTFLMYDTFAADQLRPLSWKGPASEMDDFNLRHFLHETPDGYSVGYHHYRHLKNWCRAFPGKMYIHVNEMVQGNRGIYPQNAPVMLEDLMVFRELGCAGVCYEAYEPGYAGYSRAFEIVARTMLEPALAEQYTPTELEKICCHGPISVPVTKLPDDFPFARYYSDSAELEMLLAFRRYIREFGLQESADYMEIAFREPEKWDPVWIGFTVLKAMLKFHPELMELLSLEERDLASRRKLWDFMEERSDHADPLAETGRLLQDVQDKIRFLASRK